MKKQFKTLLFFSLLAVSRIASVSATSFDQLANNPPWGVYTLDSVTNFVSLTGDGGSANVVYGVAQTGGLIEYYYGGGWQSATIATNLFNAVTCDASRANVVFGAPANGGLVQYAWNGSSWDANTVDSSHTYTALTHDTANQNTVYGAAVGGGIFQVQWNGSAWAVTQVAASAYQYKQVTIDGVAGGNKLFGLTSDGFVDELGWNGAEWVANRLDGGNSYTSIMGENNIGNTVFGARSGGGLYQIQYSGGWNVNLVDATHTYQAITDNTGNINAIFGASGNTVYSIYYGGGWNTAPVITGKTYSLIACDGVRGDALFGVVAGVVASQPTNHISVSVGTAAIQITGTVGGHYQVEYTTSLAPTNWVLLQDIPNLPSSPYTVNDPTPATNSTRFYRSLAP